MDITKLAYKELHDQSFPDHLKLWYKIITQNSRRKEFQGNTIELDKLPHLRATV